jgi:hypothetical protein
VLVITDEMGEEPVGEAIAKYDENTSVEPYEREEGTPEDFWATDMLIKEGLCPKRPTAEQVVAAYSKKYAAEESDDEKYYARDGKIVYQSTYNPDSKWDWWVIGGRWRGFFQLKPVEIAGHKINATGHLGQPGTFEALNIQDGKGEDKNYENRADQARKIDIDFAAMRDLAAAEAELAYDRFEEAVKDLPVARSWEEVCNEVLTNRGLPTEWETYVADHRPEPGVDKPDWRRPWDDALDFARKEYHAQPAMQALAKADFFFWSEGPREAFFWGDPDGRQKYIERARDNAFATYAVVKDGEWYARGEMGWFGMSRNEVDGDQWLRELNEMLDSLPDDAVLTVIDCHI